MKRFFFFSLVLATLLALPVIAPSGAQDRDLGQEIDKLQEMVDELIQQTKDQQEQIAQLKARFDAQGEAAKELVAATEKAEKGGFALPTPANTARLSFLIGVRRYAKVVTGSKPSGSLDSDVKKAEQGSVTALPVR